MQTVVNLREEIPHRFVFELRYDLGQIYWDRAGRITRQIIAENEGWDFGEIGIGNCALHKKDENLTLNFGPAKLDLSQTQTADVSKLIPIGEFGKVSERLAATVVNALEVESFSRIGFRMWHLYPTADRESSYQPMHRLKAVVLGNEFERLGNALHEVNFVAVADRGKHMIRIALAPFEQNVSLSPSVIQAAKLKARKESADQRRKLIDKEKAKKVIASYPHFGLLLDLDAYIEQPPYPDELSASDFVSRAAEDFSDVKQLILAAK